jgi:hypothetical protein
MPLGTYDLADLGYREDSSLLGNGGVVPARRRAQADGRWQAEPSDRRRSARLLVRRPVDPERFSGTVLAEWNNVSGGVDIGPDWSLLHRHLIGSPRRWASPRRRPGSTVAASWRRSAS